MTAAIRAAIQELDRLPFPYVQGTFTPHYIQYHYLHNMLTPRFHAAFTQLDHEMCFAFHHFIDHEPRNAVVQYGCSIPSTNQAVSRLHCIMAQMSTVVRMQAGSMLTCSPQQACPALPCHWFSPLFTAPLGDVKACHGQQHAFSPTRII